MRRFALLLAAFLAVVGCAGELTSPGEPLRLLSVTLAEAYEGEPFDTMLRPTGGVRPYAYELVDGTLPPGIRLEAGRLTGTPSAQGRYAFTIELRDANLNRTVQRLELRVLPLPAPQLRVDVPPTDIQRRSELRLYLERGRGWRGAEVEIRWDAERFELDPESVRTVERRLLAIWEIAPGVLRVDLALTGEPLSRRSDLLAFALTPLEPSRLAIDLTAVSVAAGGTSRIDERFGTAPAVAPSPSTDDASDTVDDDDDDDVDDDDDDGGGDSGNDRDSDSGEEAP